jgi:hypothetical protein
MPKSNIPFDPRPLAVEALAATLADPTPKVLFGTAKLIGFFTGTAGKTRQLAEHCLREVWLEETGKQVGSGAKAKSLYRLTPRGVQAVLDHAPALSVLRGITTALHRQQEQFQSILSALQALQADVHGLSAQVNGRGLSDLVGRAVDKLKAPDVEGIMAKLAASDPASATQNRAPVLGWPDEVVRRAAQTDASTPLPLPELYRDLKTTWPSLTLGQFHDGLRALRDAKRIQLRPYTRAYADIAGHREAMFLDGEVIYYVRGA